MSIWSRIQSVGAALASRSVAAATVVRDLTVRATRGLVNQAISGINALSGRQVERPLPALRAAPSGADLRRNLRDLRRGRYQQPIRVIREEVVENFPVPPIPIVQAEEYKEARGELYEYKEPLEFYGAGEEVISSRSRNLRDLIGSFEAAEEKKEGELGSDYKFLYTRQDALTIEDYDRYYNSKVAEKYALLIRNPQETVIFMQNNPTIGQQHRVYRYWNLLFRLADMQADINSNIPIPINLIRSTVDFRERQEPMRLITHYDPFGASDYVIEIKGTKQESGDEFTTWRSVTIPAFESIEYMMNIGAEVKYAVYSDSWGELGAVNIDSIEFRLRADVEKEQYVRRQRKVGLFFDRVNGSDFELSMYQIYKSDKFNDGSRGTPVHCLLYSLAYQGVTKAELNELTDILQNEVAFDIKKMSKVADALKRTIWTYQVVGGKVQKRYEVRPEYKKNGRILKLALYNTHYFVYEVTCYTREFFNKYLWLKQMQSQGSKQTFEELLPQAEWQNGVSYWPHRYKGDTEQIEGFHGGVKILMSSLDLVMALDEAGFFTEKLEKAPESVALNISKDADLSYYEEEQQVDGKTLKQSKDEVKKPEKVKKPKGESSKKYIYFFADTEDETTDTHQTLIGGIKQMDVDNYKSFNFNRRQYTSQYNYTLKQDGVAHSIMQYVYNIVQDIKKKNPGAKTEQGWDITYVPVIYFHNLKYDLHVMFRDFKDVIKPLNLLETNGIVYNFTCKFYDVTVEFRDSYKMINQALSTFGDSFKLPKHLCKKEFIGYSWYKRSNYHHTIVSIEEYLEHISKNRLDFTNLTYVKSSAEEITRKGFLQALNENAKEFEYNERSGTFNPWKYYEYYMMHDVLVMEAGLKAFDKEIHKMYGISCFESLTVSSLAHKIAKTNDAYRGVAQIRGQFRKALSEMIKGGMCHANKDLLGVMIDAEQIAIDCNSEYPASMVRLCEEYGGIPTGYLKKYTNEEEFYKRGVHKACKDVNSNWKWYTWNPPRTDGKLTEGNRSWRKGVHFFAAKIIITKVNKKQNIPFIAHLRDGILDYLNEPPFEYEYDVDGKPKKDVDGKNIKRFVPIWVSMVKLEDLVTYHNIEYEFVEGFYTDESVNPAIGNIVCKLYAAKLAAEADGNDVAVNTIKLILNSIYGKTIMKARNHATVIVENDAYDFTEEWDPRRQANKKVKTNIRKGEKADDYYYNYAHIITAKKNINEDFTIFKKYSYDNNESMPHVGALILDMSKRILYRVLDTCNELGAQVSYIDTDSIRLRKDALEEVEKVYKAKYGVELIGNGLGQFKYDIKLKYPVEDAEGNITVKKAKNVVITKELNAGKKMYLDIIRGIDHEGKEIWSHYKRCKGVTAGALDYFCKIVYWKMDHESRPLFEKMRDRVRIIRDDGDVVVMLRGYYEKIMDTKISHEWDEKTEEAFKNLGLKYDVDEKTRKSLDADSNITVKTISKRIITTPRDVDNIYFKFQLIEPSFELKELVTNNKTHITPGFDGDILQLYEDICTEKGVEIQNVVPDGKPFFEFDYCVQVKTKRTFKRTVRMQKERKLKSGKILKVCGVKGKNVLGEDFYVEKELEVDDPDGSDLELDEAPTDEVGF